MTIFEKTVGAWLKLARADAHRPADQSLGVAAPLLAGMSGSVPACQAFLQTIQISGGDQPEPVVSSGMDMPPDWVGNLFEILGDVRHKPSTDILDAELSNLVEEADWDMIQPRIDDAVGKWCRPRLDGVEDQPDHETTVEVLSCLVRNLLEAAYRVLIAGYCRRLVPLYRQDQSRVDDVFIRLLADPRQKAADTPGQQAQMDFRGKPAGEIEATLRQSDNMVIFGEQGSGKSVLLGHLAASCAESESPDALLPVFLRLVDLTGDQEMLLAEGAADFADDALGLILPKGFFIDALTSGRCLVCLDALDQVPVSERRRIVDQAEQWAQHYRESSFVVSSRLAGYAEAPFDERRFTRYAVQPMDEGGITASVDRALAEDPGSAQNLRDILDANPSLRPLASNPLLMSLLIMVYNEGSARSSLNGTEFWERASNILVAATGEEGATIGQGERHRSRTFLCSIARMLLDQERHDIGRVELEERATDFLLRHQSGTYALTGAYESEAAEQVKNLIARAERGTGLLVERGAGRGVFEFVHPLFREFLVAKGIRDRHQDYSADREACWEELQDHLEDDRWREVILLLLGNLDEGYCTYLTGKILAARYGTNHRRNGWSLPSGLQVAADALANQVPISTQLQDEIVRRLGSFARINDRRSIDDYFSPFRLVIDALSAMRHMPEQVTDALTAIASDPESHLTCRAYAAGALLKFGDETTAKALLTDIASVRSDDIIVRVSAMRWLGELGQRTPAILSLYSIATDPVFDARARTSAAKGLGELGENAAAITLLTTVATDPAVHSVTRVSASRWLGELGDMATATAILVDIGADPTEDTSRRMYAASALRALGEEATAISLLTDLASDQTIRSSNRLLAVQELRAMGAKATAIEALTGISSDPGIFGSDRASAAGALGVLGEKTTAATLLIDLCINPPDRDRSRRMPAYHLMKLCETPRSRFPGIQALLDPVGDRDRLVSAAAALGDFGEDGIAALTAIVNDPTVGHDSRWFAAFALREMGEKGMAALAAIATATIYSPEGRGAAMRVIRESGQDGIGALTEIVTDPGADTHRRSFAIEALRQLGDDGVAALISLVADPALDLDKRLVSTAGPRDEGESAMAALAAVIGDPAVEGYDRLFASFGVEDTGENPAASLAAIATDPDVDRNKRLLATYVLRQSGEEAVAALTAIVADNAVGLDRRLCATSALRKQGPDGLTSLAAIVADPAVDGAGRISAAIELGGSGEYGMAELAAIATNPRVHADCCVGAAFALGKSSEDGMAVLTNIVNDPAVHPDCRVSAASALGQMGEIATAISLLTDLVSDPTIDPIARAYAGFIFGELGETDTAMSLLTTIATDPSVGADARVPAAVRLANLGEKSTAATALRTVLDDPSLSDADRGAAREALAKLNE